MLVICTCLHSAHHIIVIVNEQHYVIFMWCHCWI